MRDYIAERVSDEGKYIAERGATVRKTASFFHLGKSTVHKDVTVRLKEIDRELYARVRKVLDVNLSERHLRGGEATREKYKKSKKTK